MFYVYTRENYPVFEPAEGGYYVSASEITYCKEYSHLNNALDAMHKAVEDAQAEGCTLCGVSWDYGFETDKYGDITLHMPIASFDESGYIGDGFVIGISVEKPEDRPYQGYC